INTDPLISLNTKNNLLLNLAAGQLKNGASLTRNRTFVTNLGGKKNGYVTIKVSVDYDGEYSLIVDYILKSTKKYNLNTLTLLVNYNSLGNVFSFISNPYIKNTTNKHEVTLKLTKGENIITFTGNGYYPAPDLGEATLTLKSKIK
ncbi:hypothetical protein, partial [Clostridium tarantellae]|uniref:hypothetical protein n=1 Tax=Clostridium tarantellae TaxID=39493 RepID=UPI003BEEBCB8